ncbi:MAG: helix-turn-helix transcriptional regulator [Bacteroidota bacterium]
MIELNIHTRLKEARKLLNLNQLNIAEDLNIHQKTVSEIENGKLLNIPNKYIYYFFKKGVSLEWIYDHSGPMMINEQNELHSDEKNEGTVGTLFDLMDKEVKAKLVGDITTSKGDMESINKEGLDTIDDLINSKDFNIKSLLSYVNSQEKMIEFLQLIVKKELNL